MANKIKQKTLYEVAFILWARLILTSTRDSFCITLNMFSFFIVDSLQQQKDLMHLFCRPVEGHTGRPNPVWTENYAKILLIIWYFIRKHPLWPLLNCTLKHCVHPLHCVYGVEDVMCPDPVPDLKKDSWLFLNWRRQVQTHKAPFMDDTGIKLQRNMLKKRIHWIYLIQ